ncbi:MAG: hypothetical protein ACYCTZ_15630 [Candidatus Dormibacteria bacterium]
MSGRKKEGAGPQTRSLFAVALGASAQLSGDALPEARVTRPRRRGAGRLAGLSAAGAVVRRVRRGLV